jgi:hypothetical protein
MHGPPAQIAEQSQPAYDSPSPAALDHSALPAIAHSTPDGPIEEVHSRLISIQVDLLFPRLRPSTKARPIMTRMAAMMA